MKTVHVESTLHNGVRRIKLRFPSDEAILNWVKQIEGRRWSRTMQCWHLPYTDYCIKELRRMKEELRLEIPEMGTLEEEKRTKYFDRHLTAEMHEYVKLMEQFMVVQRYSEKTIVTYLDAIRTFLAYCKDKSVEEISNEDVSDFNYRYVLKNEFSASYQNQIISAVKLFFRNIIKKEIIIEEIERPRKGSYLPGIFSVHEIELMLQNTRNIKHRAMLSLIYACGLRRSELINLKINSIDSSRGMLIIKGAKGNKDRVVPLPESLILLLREYYKIFKPQVFLFEGQYSGQQYSETSLREVFETAKKKSKIAKKLTLHSLRHSYATHLLENGVDLRFIQELLGHKSSKTTEIYTHVTQKSIEKIKSPFENIKLK